MARFRHASGKELNATEGTKRYRIFDRSNRWERIDENPYLDADYKARLQARTPQHIGGGWYEVDGEKYQGKEAAEEAARKASE